MATVRNPRITYTVTAYLRPVFEPRRTPLERCELETIAVREIPTKPEAMAIMRRWRKDGAEIEKPHGPGAAIEGYPVHRLARVVVTKLEVDEAWHVPRRPNERRGRR